MDLTLKMHKNSRVKRLRVQTISLNILMKNFIHLILVTHSSPSSLIFMKIIWISVIPSWLMMLLELNLIGKSITWLKRISTKCSINIRLTSDNMKKRFPQSREAFSYFQNFAFEAVTHCFRCFSHRKTSISALFNHKNDVLL